MIQSVNRALDIMMVVSNNHGVPITVSEIAKATDLNQSTCCHLIDTLVSRGFLNQVSRSAGYVLGVYAYSITRYKEFQRDLILTSMPILRWIQHKTGYTTVLTNLINGEKFVLCYADNPENSLKQKGDIYKGTLYDSATGRAMLSTLRLSELKKVVNKVGLPTKEEWPGVTSMETLEKELTKINNFPIIKVVDNRKKYICKFAVPIIGPKQQRFAIGVEIKQSNEPSKKDIEFVEEIILTGSKELVRRMKFENYGK